MNISPVSFKGMSTIRALAETQGKLSNQEKKLVEKAENYYSIDIQRASDGDWCTNKDLEVAKEFAGSLSECAKQPSRFAFLVGIDTLKDWHTAKTTNIYDSIKHSTIELADNCDEVTKSDVLKNVNILA